jgi:GNAT superfamily N-acetyltransferase
MIIRDPSCQDEASWRLLWAGYTAFYEASVADAISSRTWQRILDPISTLFARLADDDGEVIGFSVCVLHEGTWTVSPVCYLEDLFVNPSRRGQGAGGLLIRDLVGLAHERGWSRLYWHTQAGNPARRLYDEFARADDFVRYRLFFEV